MIESLTPINTLIKNNSILCESIWKTISKNKLVLILVSICFLTVINVNAQKDTTRLVLLFNKDTQRIHNENVEISKEMDVPELFSKKFPFLFGNHVKDSAKRSSSLVHFSVLPAVGYSLQTSFVAVLAFNIGIHGSKLSKKNLTNISTSFAYTLQKQYIIPLQADIWSKDEKYNFVLDWRYLLYPQSTFGLGSLSTFSNELKLKYSYLKLYNYVLRKITPNFYIGPGFNIDYHWNIKEEYPGLDSTSDFIKYGKTNRSFAAGPSFNVIYDSRRNSINPQGGFYGNISYCYHLKWMGSDNDWQSLLMEFRKYLKFPATSNNILAFWSFNWLSPSGKPAYLDLPSTGWDPRLNVGRGYIQGRYKGENFLYLEGEYRFPITRNHLLGAVVFTNVESISEWPSNQFKAANPGIGTGIRIKLNKFSRTNLALDYAFGVEGSQGVFVNLGEVF